MNTPATEPSVVAHDFPWLIAQWKRQVETCRADAARIGENEPVGRELLRDAAQYEQSIYQVETILGAAPAAAVGGGACCANAGTFACSCNTFKGASSNDGVALISELVAEANNTGNLVGVRLLFARAANLIGEWRTRTTTPPAGGFVVARVCGITPGMCLAELNFGGGPLPDFVDLGMTVHVSAPTAQPSAKDGVRGDDSDIAKCYECGAIMDFVRPGKYQHPECSQATTTTYVVDEAMVLKACNAYDAERVGESMAEYQAMFHALKATTASGLVDGDNIAVTPEEEQAIDDACDLVKVNVRLSKELLEEIDEAANWNGVVRPAMIRRMLRYALDTKPATSPPGHLVDDQPMLPMPTKCGVCGEPISVRNGFHQCKNGHSYGPASEAAIGREVGK